MLNNKLLNQNVSGHKTIETKRLRESSKNVGGIKYDKYRYG